MGLERRTHGPYAHAETVRDTSYVEVKGAVRADFDCSDGCRDGGGDAAATGGGLHACHAQQLVGVQG